MANSQNWQNSTVGFDRWQSTGSNNGTHKDEEHLDRQQYIDDQFDKLFGASPISIKEKQEQEASQQQEKKQKQAGASFLQSMAKWGLILLVIDLLVYYWPMEAPEIETKVADTRPRPLFRGPLAINERLDEAELLFKDQIHAPESMAWEEDKRAFYTGVEGGFILRVEPAEKRWTVIARLNARNSVRDLTQQDNAEQMVPYCTKDTDLYGSDAEFSPTPVRTSRCSRPLGIRLSPAAASSDAKSYLYVSDSLSGLYRVDLALKSAPATKVSKLLDFSAYQSETWTPASEHPHGQKRVLFADDIAVDWGAGTNGSDVIYLTDCSQRWTVRYLVRLMLENDDSGRVLRYETGDRQLTVLGSVTPVARADGLLSTDRKIIDKRNLSFPNGVELTANKSALLISDLNNRRILMHHLKGPLAGITQQLLWAPGYSDNIRRGLDLPDGQPTYWAACGCAVSDGRFEPAEMVNDWPRFRKLTLKALHFLGFGLEKLGQLMHSTRLQDAGLMFRAIWLKVDPYCLHGVVFQFTEQGRMLRSLHAPHFSSNFKLISEAHEVPSNNNQSVLYLGSVYYSYLGKIDLEPLIETAQ